MSLSKSEEKMLDIQHHLRENQQELSEFLKDMDDWESEVKQKDEKLKKTKTIEEAKLPPVRNSLNKKKKLKKQKPKEQIAATPTTNGQRISGYDYRSWDKLDVDKMCEEVDEKEKSDSSEYETDEEWEMERKKQQAVIEKDRGNDLFRSGDYTLAIEAYTKGIDLDPCNPLLPANRAMALLKQKKYAAAETDCLTALTFDPLYIKAHLRLGSARFEMKKFKEAKEVFEKVLLLEPQNKKAKMEIELIEKELIKEQRVTQTLPTADPDAGVVKAITKPPNERSKKPLRRIEIEEVGFEDDVEIQAAITKTKANQGKTKKNITQKDEEMFEHFMSSNSGAQEQACVEKSEHSSDTNSARHEEMSTQRTGKSVAKIVEIKQPVDKNIVKEEFKLDLSKENKTHSTKQSESVSPRTADSLSPKSSESVSPRSLAVPQTSFQFQADYKILKNNLGNFYQYIKKIIPENYPKLFGESLESGTLLNMLNVYREYFIPAGEDICPHLHYLTNVKRFSMTVMFFSHKEQQVVKDIFAHLRNSGKVTPDNLDKLAKKYQIT